MVQYVEKTSFALAVEQHYRQLLNAALTQCGIVTTLGDVCIYFNIYMEKVFCLITPSHYLIQSDSASMGFVAFIWEQMLKYTPDNNLRH